MKKRILTMLLSALLAANLNACASVPENAYGVSNKPTNTPESTATTDKPTNTPESTATTDKTTESEADADKKPERKSPAFYNGVWDNSNVTYTYNQNGTVSLYIADWGEEHLVSSLSSGEISAFKYALSAVGANNERAFVLLEHFYEPKITVVSFEKGSQGETVAKLDVDEGVYRISGNFINESVGYLFAFTEEIGGHSRGSARLSNLFKTEDGGNTWNAIHVQSVPLLNLRNDIMFAKMISEDVGLISGGIGPADYDFCERTLLTTDGGFNWVHVNIPELPQEDDLYWATVADFTQVDDSCILTIRYETPEGNYDDAKYKLQDTNTWIRIN